MAPRGKDLSLEQKQMIIKLNESGLSSRKNSEIIGISPNSIQKIVRRNAERSSMENRERQGRNRLVGERGDRVLSRLVKKNRRQTLSDLTDKFYESVPQKVFYRTVRRRLKEQKYQRCSVLKKITISKPNRQNRVLWCRSKLGWTVEENWSQEFPASKWILQEDNCPVHQSRQTVEWKTTNRIPTLTWPSQSPDINIIENVRRTIKIRLENRLDKI
ncbi:uncharacterized protein LOC133178856 [Saccostrea echinata]|uniref:uncharacterized protein LOC133178856 n=1 Tax=Saccostrea echinata TaxID=191078 RepID=UPI002A8138D7|nr:uncharacterized protein LOC133178856 [Saccostrea echinata]